MWDDSELTDSGFVTVDNAKAPAVKSNSMKVRTARRLVKLTVFVATPLALLLWLGDFVAADNDVPLPTVSSLEVNGSLGKPVALSTMLDWLNPPANGGNTPASPLPGGFILAWDGFESPHSGVELHYFTLAAPASGGYSYFDSVVEVLVDPALGARANASPTLIPRVPDAKSGFPQGPSWLGYETAAVPTPVAQAVDSWVSAYTSGRPELLRLATGDPNSENSYLPLSGATAGNIQTPAAAYALVGGEKTTSPETILVRVTFTLSWGSDDRSLPVTTMDLLVVAANTGSPRVVAWGGPGTGPRLTAFVNAVSGRQSVMPTPAPAPPSPSPSPTPGDPTTPSPSPSPGEPTDDPTPSLPGSDEGPGH